jgi:hypothetical protein
MDNSIMFRYDNEFHENGAINVKSAVQIILRPKAKYCVYCADFHKTPLQTASDEKCTKYDENFSEVLK